MIKLCAVLLYYPLQLVGFVLGFLAAPLVLGFNAGYMYIYYQAKEEWTQEVQDALKDE